MDRPALPRALEAIAAQTHRPLEIVLVDAAAKGLARASHQDLPVRVVGGGPFARAAAANAGLAAARGDWIAFLDEDDEIAPSHLAALLAAAERTALPVAYSQTRLIDASGTMQRIFGGPFDRARLLQSNYLQMNAVVFRRSFVDDGCRFDESYAIFEDWDFWLQLAARTDFAFTGEPTALYYAAAGQSGAGTGPNLDRDQALAHRNRLMAKWALTSDGCVSRTTTV